MANDVLTTREPEERAGLAVVAGGATILEVISRAARDPATDVDKLERLLIMYERMTAQQAKADYTAALSEMQPELPVIVERGEIKISNNSNAKPQRYALWEDINDAIKPVLHEHGFALSFRTGRENDQIIVTGVLSHRGGHSEQTTMYLPIDTSGSKNAVQAVGSSTSYGKRYTAAALLNLTSRGEDDDGWTGGSKCISDAQRDALNILADSVGADKKSFCRFLGVESLAQIPERDYKRAEDALKAKGRKQGDAPR